ncbi:hypothetical protein [Glaciecola sp. 1036]|uniref:hypothetical protein n=1 Tax=Alteromonadaceae TaxID=72275 RepID=UPI003D0913D3
MSQNFQTPDIVQLLLPEQGRSRPQRLPQGLASDYVKIDERQEAEYFDFIKELSAKIKFYSNDPEITDNNWGNFFDFAQGQSESWFEQHDGQISPHLSLLKVFVEKLIEGPIQQQNTFLNSYVNYYYQDVLRFSKNKASPDHAHVIISLKNASQPVLISTEQAFLAGKDEFNNPILANPTMDTVINLGQIAEKRTIYVDDLDKPGIKIAPIADSFDGLGEDFPEDKKVWSGFGHQDLTACEIGFALSSSLLNLAEGEREISIELTLASTLSKNETNFDSVFKVYLSSEEGWTQGVFASAVAKGNLLTLTVRLDVEAPAIVNYSQDLHGFSLDANAPVVQVTIDSESTHPLLSKIYKAHIDEVKLRVDVTGVTNIQAKSDAGLVSTNSAFFPFGTNPKAGSEFSITSDEIFSKRLAEVKVNIEWKKAPRYLSSIYTAYHEYETHVPELLSNEYFTADASVVDGNNRNLSQRNVSLFSTSDARAQQQITVSENPPIGPKILNFLDYTSVLGSYQSLWAQKRYGQISLISPMFSAVNTSKTKKKYNRRLSFVLDKSFFHEEYRKAYVKSVMAAKDVDSSIVSEPYTPEIGAISVDYQAYTQSVKIAGSKSADFANDAIRFYHLDCFGQRREHSYQRSQMPFAVDPRVSLFPYKTEKGSLLLGLENLQPGDSCQLLFKVVEGSANPSLVPADITWSVLCDNYFKPLDEKSLIFDHTQGLQTTGIVRVIFPKEATTEHSLMPSGYLWIKLAITGSAASVCQLEDIFANAIEVVAVQDEAQMNATKIASGAISKLQKTVSAIKKIEQPFAGFGGQSVESDDDFAARVSARLRHKDRAITLWDYESMILANFPQIHRVKALPHARPGHWQAPQHITLLVVPYVEMESSSEPLTPKVSTHTLESIKDLLLQKSAMQAQLHVVNPSYVYVRMQFQVRFMPGIDFNFYQQELNDALVSLFAPWTNDSANAEDTLSSPKFGGRVFKSVVMDFIEELPYVDFITQVVMQASEDGSAFYEDTNSLKAMSPDQILTSASEHLITEVTDD